MGATGELEQIADELGIRGPNPSEVKNERADPVTMRPKGGARVAVRRPQETSVVDLPDQRRTANFIAAQLRQAIRDGLYGYGEQMPPERQRAKNASSISAARRLMSRTSS